MRAFVSHSSADDRYVAEMESFLRAAGFDDVFNDVSAIRPDEKFWPEIEKGIANCDSFVVVITAASNSSEWVTREVEYARSLSKNIIPLWVEDCPLPSAFADRDVIDFRPRSREERRYDISRIVKYAPAELIGRQDETKLLHDAWGKVLRAETKRPHILTFVALGGEGKTSLVAKWAADLAAQDWPGCDAAFAWSFYSQGTREQQAASSDLFLKEALNFFGDDEDKEFAASPAGSFEKGQRLARIVGAKRALLILDGLEPLQYAPTATAFKPGELKDQGVAKLLKDLATNSHGLCIVTTRISLPDLRAFWQITAPEAKLLRLSRDAGVCLLKTLEVRGSERRNIPVHDDDPHSEPVNEFEKLVEDVKGHALTLQIMGGFLKRAFGGDIRQRDRVKFEKADEKIDGGHAFRAMATYAQWLEDGSDEGRRELAILRLLGLFDRPADAGCIGALRREPAIDGLTESLVGLDEADWNLALSSLAECGLLSYQRDQSAVGHWQSAIDSHPHIREYFAKELREKNPDAWRAAHRRLYEHLCATTKEGDRPTLEDLQPLYQAVAHGCHAGLQKEVFKDVYDERLQRTKEHYPHKKLGAVATDLGCIAGFFSTPWHSLPETIPLDIAERVLDSASESLHSVGKLREARQAMEALNKLCTQRERISEITNSEILLSEVSNSLGELEAAILHAKKAIATAKGRFQKKMSHVALGIGFHQQGAFHEAAEAFRFAESFESKREDGVQFLCSLQGYAFCDFLVEIARRHTNLEERDRLFAEIEVRAKNSIGVATATSNQLTVAVSRLQMVQIKLTIAQMKGSAVTKSFLEQIDLVVSQLRRAGDLRYVPYAVFTRAWLRFLAGKRTGSESAQEDLDEAWEIAERGPMKLHMADVHLYRARLFGGMKDEGGRMKYPWDKNPDGSPRGPKDDLAAAERLIKACGYHRRDEELADAKEASKSW